MNKKLLSIVFIIISGEAIFMLPFLIPRLYRPLMLDAWNLTNTDIGMAFSAYGVSAMFSYILGGHFADKYSPRYLLSISLVTTAFSGLFLLFFPSTLTLVGLYFFFGISTIFLMWGALIKVTHVMGGEENRSTAMGVLDSGRGLSAAVMSSLLVYVVSFFFTDSQLEEGNREVLSIIYATTIIVTILVAVILWWSMESFEEDNQEKKDRWNWNKALKVLKDSKVWLLGFVVLSAYCGYKSIDNYSIYLVDIHGKSLADSALLTSIIFWLRPISALLAGFAADKFQLKKANGRLGLIALFLILGAILQFMLALNFVTSFSMIFSIILFSAAFAYALRSIYFSIFGGLGINSSLIGTTVGIVSFVGFLPDMFFGITTGKLIDTFPGSTGYSYTFLFTGSILFLGAVAALILITKLSRNGQTTDFRVKL